MQRFGADSRPAYTAGVREARSGLYPGAVLLIAAAGLAVAQRNTLARAIRTPDSNRRRRRLSIGAVLVVVFVASYVTYDSVAWPNGKWTITMTLLLLIGVPAMFGAIAFLIAGLLTPKSGDHPAQPVVELG